FDRFRTGNRTRGPNRSSGEAMAEPPVKHSATAGRLTPPMQLKESGVAIQTIEEIGGIRGESRCASLEQRGGWRPVSLRQWMGGIDPAAEFLEQALVIIRRRGSQQGCLHPSRSFIHPILVRSDSMIVRHLGVRRKKPAFDPAFGPPEVSHRADDSVQQV